MSEPEFLDSPDPPAAPPAPDDADVEDNVFGAPVSDADVESHPDTGDDHEFEGDETFAELEAEGVHPEIAKRQAQENANAQMQGREPHEIAEHQLNIEQSVGAPDSGPPGLSLEEMESRGSAERIILEGVNEEFDAEFDAGVNIPGLDEPDEFEVASSPVTLAEEEAATERAEHPETEASEEADVEGPNATEAAVVLAAEKDVDLDDVEGSGADGRIVKSDVEAAASDAGDGGES